MGSPVGSWRYLNSTQPGVPIWKLATAYWGSADKNIIQPIAKQTHFCNGAVTDGVYLWSKVQDYTNFGNEHGSATVHLQYNKLVLMDGRDAKDQPSNTPVFPLYNRHLYLNPIV